MSAGELQLLMSTVRLTASYCAELAAEHGLETVNERDHLQKQFNRALVERAAVWPDAPVVKADRRCDLSEHFDHCGDVDASIRWPGESPVFIELKAGAGKDSLGPCIWDVLKLATALRTGACSSAYLVAAAPQTRWASPKSDGNELFAPSQVYAADLRDRYPSWWRFWERDTGARPTRVPAALRTDLLEAVPFRTAADGAAGDWTLKIASVHAVPADAEWLAWETPGHPEAAQD